MTGIVLSILSAGIFLFVLLRPPDVPLTKFVLHDLNNHSINLAELKGKPTVVNFWATWCVPCLKELPDFLKAKEALGEKVNFIYISDETSAKVSPFLAQRKFAGNFYCNAFALESIGLTVRPTTYFYNSDGKLADKVLGDIDYDTIIKKLSGLQ